MKLKNILTTTAIASAILSTSAFAAPSAKFAATWTKSPALASVAVIKDATGDAVMTEEKMGYTMATIKVPQDKELLVGVSSEIGLVTDTSIKGKNGGTAKSIADAAAYVTIYAVPVGGGEPIMAEPGQITLSKRVQALSATLAGVIQECTDGSTYTDGVLDSITDEDGDGISDTADGTIDIATECAVTDEEIGLALDTTAAHHFNFVLPNMNQGEYDIKAVFSTGARAEIQICDDGDMFTNSDGTETPCAYDDQGSVSGSSYAKAVVNKTMVTVQQVRAAEGGLIDTEIEAQ